MALTIPGIYQALENSFWTYTGSAKPGFTMGLAIGIYNWATNPANLSLSGSVTGMLGTGAVEPTTTQIIIPPDIVAMTTALNDFSIEGVLRDEVARALAFGVSQAFLSAQYTGTSPTVAQGPDISFPQRVDMYSLSSELFGGLDSTIGTGEEARNASYGIAEGITRLVQSATCTGTVLGIPVPPASPASGPTFSYVL